MTKRVLIMAGGTGGHIFPALAIANKLRQNGVEILWLGTRGRLEEVLVPKNGFDIAYIDVKGIRRNGLLRKLTAPFMIVRALLQSIKIILKFKPQVAIGMGGYASGPGGLAAFLLGIKVVLHEQNAAAGLTNRLLFKIASKVLLGFKGAFTGNKVEVVGNPVREEIISLYKKHEISDASKPLNILIVGGSLGAMVLNNEVPKALALFKDNISVLHQCGKGNSDKVRVLYANCQFKYEVTDFIDDMAKAYTDADLIICRAGALTVSEVCVANVPAIFIPLPSAVDDHQTKNAQFLVNEQAAILMPQSQLDVNKLYECILNLNKHRELLVRMQDKMQSLAITDASDKVCEIIKSYL